jgi:predicted nucleic acid-binding protein
MPTIVLDTDFLSAFLKISRFELIKSLYQVESTLIPLAVYRELARTDLLKQLIATASINVSMAEPLPDETLLQDSTFQALGAGEQSCILLAYAEPDSVLLINDNKARRFAQSQGVVVANIPAFLLACKKASLVSLEEMAQIIKDLKDKDFYEFKPEIRDALLK